MSRALTGLVAALLLGGCGGAETTTQPLLAPTTPVEPAERVEAPAGTDAGLQLVCEGEGTPTVILEAGFGSASAGWQQLQTELSALTRICRYDRAGLGSSPLPEQVGRRTAATQVRELSAALEQAGIDAPFVLAGHSYGGALARLFAHTYPDRVTGLVLVDASHPDERAEYLAVLPRRSDPRLDALRAQLAMRFDPLSNPERLDWEASMTEIRGAGDLGDVPLVVITAGRAGPRSAQGIPPEFVEPLEEVRMELHGALARLSRNSLHAVATESGHAVPDPDSGAPEVIVAAVEAVLLAARERAPLPPCEEVFTRPATRCLGRP